MQRLADREEVELFPVFASVLFDNASIRQINNPAGHRFCASGGLNNEVRIGSEVVGCHVFCFALNTFDKISGMAIPVVFGRYRRREFCAGL